LFSVSAFSVFPTNGTSSMTVDRAAAFKAALVQLNSQFAT